MRRPSSFVSGALPRRFTLTVLCLAATACDDRLVVGQLGCPDSEGGAAAEETGALRAPWETSFEDGFCGYRREAGFCYSDEGAGYRVVTSPVRTGPFAAAFDLASGGHQARCVREGALPEAAYYSAWYYVPADILDTDNWNLFHFRGGVERERLFGTWDVSVRRNSEGEPSLFVWDLRTLEVYSQEVAPMPLNRWFKIELFLAKAADETGEVALFQDGQELVRVTDVVTDDNPFTQWYVGNLITTRSDVDFTLYVDDVRIELAR